MPALLIKLVGGGPWFNFLLTFRFRHYCGTISSVAPEPVWESEKMVLRSDIGNSNYHLVYNAKILYLDTGVVHVPEFWFEYLEKVC